MGTYMISGNREAVDMMNDYLARNKKKIQSWEGDTPEILITQLVDGAKLVRDYKKDSIELTNPDRDTVKNLARIIRRTIK